MLRTPPDEASLHDLLEELATKAEVHRFEVAPNPCVGAALIRGDQVVAEGFHEAWGGAHAEIQALRAAERLGLGPADWDTLAVTLEPCSSHGKTPPCTDAILAAGPSRVVVGRIDPDERHGGRGIELLRAAGIQVERAGPGSGPRLSRHFESWTSLERRRRPRPWLIAKWAQTRTGQLQPPADVGEGRWISSEASRAEVAVLRSRVDAILTGVGTVLADDPRLTVRGPAAGGAAPARVVLDSGLRTSPRARLFEPPSAGESAGPIHLITRPGAHPTRHRELAAAGATVHAVRTDDDGHPSLRGVLECLWELGFRRVLLEAGPVLQRAFLEAGFVDQLRVYSGSVNGGRGTSLADLLDPWGFDDVLHREVGEDAVLEAFPKRR